MRSEQLEMRWMPVLDPAGRTRLEASWIPVSAAAATSASASATSSTTHAA